MKASNHRSQHLTGVSVGLAEYESPIPPQIHCPLINGTLPRSSCRAKQADPDMPMCRADENGNCRAKQPIAPKPSKAAREKMIKKASLKTYQAEQRARVIVGLYSQGESVESIANQINCCRELVYRRLRERGIFQKHATSIRTQVLIWLDSNPLAELQQIQDLFGCSKTTACTYRAEWRRAAQGGAKKQ